MIVAALFIWMKASEVAETVKGIGDYGFLIVFASFVLAGGAWVGHRLFSEKGIITQLTQKHISFIDRLEKTINRMADSTELANESLETTNSAVTETNEKIDALLGSQDANSTRAKKVARHACKVLRRISEKLEIYDSVKEPLGEIDDLLR